MNRRGLFAKNRALSFAVSYCMEVKTKMVNLLLRQDFVFYPSSSSSSSSSSDRSTISSCVCVCTCRGSECEKQDSISTCSCYAPKGYVTHILHTTTCTATDEGNTVLIHVCMNVHGTQAGNSKHTYHVWEGLGV